MRIRRIARATSLAVVLAALAVPAWAQSTVEECRARIDVIQTDLDAIFNAGGIGGNNPQQTYTGLTSKLHDAGTKLDRRKFSDALQKLQNFQTAVIALRDAAKPKVSAADAGLLLDGDGTLPIDEGVNGAIACVALLP
jgi:acetate kinase